MTQDGAAAALSALLRGDTPECRRSLRTLNVAHRKQLADGCHLLLAEIGRANLEGLAEAVLAPPRLRVVTTGADVPE